MRQVISLLVNNNNEEITPIIQNFKCQAENSGPEFPENINNNSTNIPLRVYPAKVLIAPLTGVIREGDKHEMGCVFPDSNVESKYSVTWKLNKEVYTFIDHSIV